MWVETPEREDKEFVVRELLSHLASDLKLMDVYENNGEYAASAAIAQKSLKNAVRFLESNFGERQKVNSALI